MRQSLCEISIICEKKQTFGLCVQAPNVEQPREFCWQQIKNCIAHTRISPGRNESGGLVQHYGERRGKVNKFAIHLDVVARAGLGAKVSAGFTINSNPAGSDQFIALPSRPETGRGEETIEAHNVIRNSLHREPLSRLNDVTIQRFTTLHVGLCLRQADHFLTVLPLAAFLQKLDALEAFQHVALSSNGAGPF